MHLEQQQVTDDFRLLHMRDLAPEEFVSWLLEWGASHFGPGRRVPLRRRLSVCLIPK